MKKYFIVFYRKIRIIFIYLFFCINYCSRELAVQKEKKEIKIIEVKYFQFVHQ